MEHLNFFWVYCKIVKKTLICILLFDLFDFLLDNFRELVAQAFRAWEIVIALDFMEAKPSQPISEVDIVFEFSDRNALNKNDRTGFN